MVLFSKKTFRKHSHRPFLYISFIILCLYLTFVAINYYSSSKAFNTSLLHRAETRQNEFNLTLDTTYRNMLQLSTLIGNNDELNQLFLAGKKALIKEGGGSGGQETKRLRQALLDKLERPWSLMTKEFGIRQLHYQLGPGSLSYLRVHNPSKFGDRMDDLRFTIVDTNAEKTSRMGFETGRIYSGLRGISPVWTIDPKTNLKTYVGAVEVGTSFKQILPLLTKPFHVESAVILTKQHVLNKMWPEFINAYFKDNPNIDYYFESSSSDEVNYVLSKTNINESFSTKNTTLIKTESQYYSSYYFPFFDYQGIKNGSVTPVGFILIWEDVSAEMKVFKHSLLINIIISLFAFVLIEICLLWILSRESKLSMAEQEATIDGLTGIHNRRYYDIVLEKELQKAKRTNQPLSLIMFDIDFFKSFNDTYGHSTGDQGLRQVATATKDQVQRSSDVVARFGGEEFAIILPNTPLEQAVDIAENIRKAILSLNIPHKASSVCPYLTISLGVSCTQNLQEDAQLFEVADANLYHAKNTGRNKVAPPPNDTEETHED